MKAQIDSKIQVIKSSARSYPPNRGRVRVERMVIQNEMVEGGSEWLTERSTYVSKKLAITQDLLEDFQVRNQQPYHISDQFDLGVQVELISREESCKIIFGPGGWDRFHAQYPNSYGLKELSRVGFNARGNQALVYVGNTAHGLLGAGYFVLLTKVDDKWIIQEKCLVWA